MSNGDDGSKTMEVGSNHAGKTFIDATHKRNEEIVIDENGFATFLCAAGSVSVWIIRQ